MLLTFTPARLSAIETEKKTIANDMANLGWRTVPQTGAKTPATQVCATSINGRFAGSAVAVRAGTPGQRFQPALPSFGVCEQGSAERALLPVREEPFPLGTTQQSIQGIGQQCFELCALHSGLVFAGHQITCL